MRDPHVHVERTPFPGFTHARMRELITTATVPERVTCLACRDYAARQHLDQAESADALLSVPESDPVWSPAKVTPAGLAEAARQDRAMAARYASPEVTR